MPKQDISVRDLVSMIERGELKLPEIQRKYVWPATRVRDLLDSLYRGYPAGTILVWETLQDAPKRDLAVSQATNSFATSKLLLDGQQRLTSLSAVIRGEPIKVRNRRKPIDILFNLEHPDGPPVDITEVEEDYDPMINTSDEEAEDEDELDEDASTIRQSINKKVFVVSSKQLAQNPKWVKVSDVFKGKSDRELLKPLQDKVDDSTYDKFADRVQRLRKIMDYSYVMQILDRDLAYEEVAEIFVRVNSLGVKLRGSDLALAQITAKWKNSSALFEDFCEGVEDASWFSLDIGLIVRTIVVFATKQCRFKTVGSLQLATLEKAWADAKGSLEFAINFLRTNAGIEDESLLSSPYVIIALAAYISVRNNKLTADEERKLLRWTLVTNGKGRYSKGSSETILDQDLAIIFRQGSVDDLLGALKNQFNRLNVTPTDLIGKNARSTLFSSAFLALKKKGAKDWISGLGLSLTHQGKLHYIEYHHIFPKSLLANAGYEQSQINEMSNLAFISGKANRKITNKEPIKYLQSILDEHGQDYLVNHAIPLDKELWKVENYPAFLEARRKMLAEEISKLYN